MYIECIMDTKKDIDEIIISVVNNISNETDNIDKVFDTKTEPETETETETETDSKIEVEDSSVEITMPEEKTNDLRYTFAEMFRNLIDKTNDPEVTILKNYFDNKINDLKKIIDEMSVKINILETKESIPGPTGPQGPPGIQGIPVSKENKELKEIKAIKVIKVIMEIKAIRVIKAIKAIKAKKVKKVILVIKVKEGILENKDRLEIQGPKGDKGGLRRQRR